MSESNGSIMDGMFNPETHYAVRVDKEVNGYPILTGEVLKADAGGLWLNWHVNDIEKRVYVPFTNITHIEERSY